MDAASSMGLVLLDRGLAVSMSGPGLFRRLGIDQDARPAIGRVPPTPDLWRLLHDHSQVVHTCGVIREASANDFDAVMRLYRQLHPDDPILQDDSDHDVFKQIAASPSLHLLVLERGGEVVATAYLNVILNLTRSASPYAVIENVVVDETLRGTGLGKMLMAATLEWAWRAGCYKAMLMTGSKRPSTHAFYRACGFSADAKTGYVASRQAPE
jgi:GNAT superfamily N-acetyltransferase